MSVARKIFERQITHSFLTMGGTRIRGQVPGQWCGVAQ